MLKNGWRRALCCLLALTCYLLPLAGCVARPQGESTAVNPDAAGNLTANQPLDALRYTSESDLTKTITMARGWGVTEEGEVWTYGKLLSNLDKTGDGYAVVWMNESGSVQRSTILTLPTAPKAPEGGEVRQDIGAVYLGEGDAIFAVVSRETWTQEPYSDEQVISDFALTLCRSDADGALQPQTQLALPEQLAADVATLEMPFGGAFAAADGGCWLLLASLQESVMDSWLVHYAVDGSCAQTLQLGQNVFQAVPVSATQALFGSMSADGNVFGIVDGLDTAKASVAKHDLAPLSRESPLVIPCVLTPQPKADALLLATSDGVWQWDGKTSAQDVLRYSTYGLGGGNDNMPECCFSPDGENLVLITRRPSAVEYKFHSLNSNTEQSADGKTVITVGITNTDTKEKIEEQVYRYNAANAEYEVRLVDYDSKTNWATGITGGLDQMQADILNGTVPDILLVPFNFPNQALLNEGFFVDLYPYLDADPELQRDDFLPNILQLCEHEGALPTIITSFYLYTAVARPDVVGSDPGWTWAEFDQVWQANPQLTEVIDNLPKTITLSLLLEMGGDKYLDYDAHTCYLDSPDLVRLLEWSAYAPDEMRTTQLVNEQTGAKKTVFADPRENFAQGTSLLWAGTPLLNFRDVLKYKFDLGGDFVYKGFPSDTGSGNAIYPRMRWGITSYCRHPDAAWDFLRQLLLPDYNLDAYKNVFSSRRDALQQTAERAQQPRTDFWYLPSYLDENQLTEEEKAYWLNGVSEEECEELWKVIESADVLFVREQALVNIINEELTDFYNGQRTAEETAKIMQNRVQTYLDEQA